MKLQIKSYRKYGPDMLGMALVVFLLGASDLCFAQNTENLPPNVLITNAAWEAFNGEMYESAIKKVAECIDDFAPTAQRQHRELVDNADPLPPEGKVMDNKMKKQILERGLVNDVATCWFIKGRSLEKLKKTKGAIVAYCETAKYIYARTYDPSWDGFWSPAKVANDRVLSLGGKCNHNNN